MYSIQQITEIIRGQCLQLGAPFPVHHLLLDSRKLLFPSSSLFFSLPGKRRNGDQFIPELYNRGVRGFVVGESCTIDWTSFPEASCIQVNQVLDALQMLAAEHRKQFQLPVAGITGSNGKTIVKEWLYQLLHHHLRIVRSPRSYNSQIGVPLSIWQIQTGHQLGLFEAGISQPGEMERLEKMIRPGIGIFTNIGEAHSEGFLNIRQKINEKLRLFTQSHTLIYSQDDRLLHEQIIQFASTVHARDQFRLFTWSRKSTATLQVTRCETLRGKTRLEALYGEEQRSVAIEIPFTDEASIENAIHCWCLLLLLNIPDEAITDGMRQLRPVAMRLELKKGINQCSVINDSYSADINSLSIALDFLLQQNQHPKRTLILSDILQTGKTGAALYQAIAAILAEKKINRLIGVGTEISQFREAFHELPETSFFTSTADFREHFHQLHFHQETILLKGARLFEFEQIGRWLEEKVHQTVLEINLNAVTHNLNVYQQQLKPGVKIMAMVKASGYGNGSFEIANLLQFHRVDYLTVAYADEGVELRKAGITLPIMVMSPEAATFESLVEYDLEPELYSVQSFQSFASFIESAGIAQYPVHIKIDSGMHRLGFETAQLDELCRLLDLTPQLRIQSVFSHLVGSGDARFDEFTREQATRFLHSCNRLQTVLRYPFLRHIANTSAIHRHPDLQLDMVRLGIGLYGCDAQPEIQQQLKNVTTLKTTIAQIKQLDPGETVGYDRRWEAGRPASIATVRIGYADGYRRSLGNGVGYMLVNGHPAPVVGSVCMDMTMLDITGIPAREGDDVLVFGEALPVTQLADWAGTIPYEILTGVSQRVQRVYFEE